MPKPIKILADSTCDLSPALIAQYEIEIVPLVVTLGEASYHDGVDVKPEQLYAYYRETGDLPKTAAPSPAVYREAYQKWAGQGYAVISFHISSFFSASYANAAIAAADFEDVYPIDSQNLSTGIGLQVLRGAEMAAQGLPPQEIARTINALREKVRASFIIDKLEFLWKGGRCSGVTALGANVLRLKPCIEVIDGKMEVGKKYRGDLIHCLQNYVRTKLEKQDSLDLRRIFITHSGLTNPEHAETIRSLVWELAPFEEVHITHAGCTICTHCGPNTLGILFYTK